MIIWVLFLQAFWDSATTTTFETVLDLGNQPLVYNYSDNNTMGSGGPEFAGGMGMYPALGLTSDRVAR
jgi:hypothetical protein